MNDDDLKYLNSAPDGRCVIKTARLEIRELVRKNAGSVLNILNECPSGSFFLPELDRILSGPGYDPETAELTLGSLIASDITDQYRFFGYGLWGVCLHGRIIGLAMLKNGSASGICEIGYAVCEQYRRQGYMTEAMLAILEYARRSGFVKAQVRPSGNEQISGEFFRNLRSEYYNGHDHSEVDSLSLTL